MTTQAATRPVTPSTAEASVAQASVAQGPAVREAFSRVPSAVTVVTSFGPDGPCGMTASAVCPLSVDPPLLLVCFANDSRTLSRLREHGRFAVNTLLAEDSALAARFADATGSPGPRFGSVAYHVVDAVPVLASALGFFTCSVLHTYPGGDHTIVIGGILSMRHTDGGPLLWHARDYRALKPSTAGGHEPRPADSSTADSHAADRTVDSHGAWRSS